MRAKVAVKKGEGEVGRGKEGGREKGARETQRERNVNVGNAGSHKKCRVRKRT